jgi:hypothetical protein
MDGEPVGATDPALVDATTKLYLVQCGRGANTSLWYKAYLPKW